MLIAKKIGNTLLAITLLVATTGVTLNKHYCMGRLKSLAVNVHAEQCFSGEQEKMPCCEDVSQELKVEEVTTPDFDFEIKPAAYQLSAVTWILYDFYANDQELEVPSFTYYSPPLPDADFQIKHQVFLL